jgi:hypothetical protein
MATNISTDIAQEINITARRGDTFELGLSVVGSDGQPLFLGGTQGAGASQILTAYAGSGFNPAITYVPQYQAKMTVKKQGSEFDVLSVYTFFWKDMVFANILPSLTKAGKYRGETFDALENKLIAGIHFSGDSSSEGLVNIRIPSAYMNMAPGTYVYDFQVRKKDFFTNPYNNTSTVDSSASYTTWFKGDFIVNNDITKQ